MTIARSSSFSFLVALASLAATGCEIDMSLGDPDATTGTTTSNGDDTGATSSSADSSSASADSSSASADPSSASADSGNGDAAEGVAEGGESSSSDTGETAGAACEPPPEDLVIHVDIDPEPPEPFAPNLLVDADCVVADVVEDGDLRSYALECDEGGRSVSHLLEVTRSSGPIELPMAAGTAIHLQATRNYPIDSGGFTYVVVRDAAGELVLGWYGGPYSPNDVDVDAWFAPLEFALAFGDCEPMPYEEPGGSFLADPCPAAETRVALDFQLGDDGIHLLGQTSGQLGPLSLFVTRAQHLDPVDPEEWCGIPLDAFSFVAYRPI